MKDQKRKIETFSFYDHTSIENHLEKMAQKGWLLKKMNRFTWEYHRIQPKKIHFAVTYYPKASEFDPEPLEGQLVYRDYSEYSGWKFICSSAQMQIFYNEEENPVPLETDPTVEVNVIHKAAKRVFLPSQYLLLGITILQAALFISSLLGDPIRLLASTTQLTTGFLWALLFLQCASELITYHRWYHKARKAAENGEFLDTHSHVLFQKILLLAAIVGCIYIIINLLSAGDKFQLMIYVLLLAGVIALVAIVCGVKDLLKQKKASRTTNFTVTLVVDIVLALALFAGVTFGTIRSVQTEKYEPDSILYQVEAPLTVEDLVDISFDGYIKENRQSESIFLGQRALWQWPRREGNEHIDVPTLQYTVTIVKVPAIYNFCKNSMVNKPKDRLDNEGNLFINHYEAVDASPWQAKEAYQLHWSEGILFKYILCYEDRLIVIDFDWEPTEEQMRIVAEKLAYTD